MLSRRATLAGLAGLGASACSDTTVAVATSWRNDIAALGWDVVSFFQGEPARGRREFVETFGGAEWRFSTEANRDVFGFNPEAFLPEYGGYCAWAVAHNKLARGNPLHWSLVEGRLFFNFNDRTHRLWGEDRGYWIDRADGFWPGVLA